MTHYLAHRAAAIACAGVTAMMLAACTGASPSASMISTRLLLNAPAGGQQAGFMLARKLGFYAAEGLDVELQEGRGSFDAAQRTAHGEADFAFADAHAIGSSSGLKLVARVFQASPYVLISLAQHPIRRLEDLQGKAVGARRATQAGARFEPIAASAGADVVDLAESDFDPALRSERVVAVVGRRDVDSLRLRHAGSTIVELAYDAEPGGLSLAARDELMQRDPGLVDRFARASLKGWAAARDDPRAAGRAVVEQFLAGYEEEIVEQLVANLPSLCTERCTP